MFHPPLAESKLKIRSGLKLNHECSDVSPVFYHALILTPPVSEVIKLQ
jgi:hypothetical protein